VPLGSTIGPSSSVLGKVKVTIVADSESALADGILFVCGECQVGGFVFFDVQFDVVMALELGAETASLTRPVTSRLSSHVEMISFCSYQKAWSWR